jgi:hypothetical protein
MKQERRTDTNIITNTKNGHDLTVCLPYVLNKTYRPIFHTQQSTGVIQWCNRVFYDSAIYFLEKIYFVHNVKNKHVQYKAKNIPLTQHRMAV